MTRSSGLPSQGAGASCHPPAASRFPGTQFIVADTLRYRLDFVVPERHEIVEAHDSPARNETLDRVRAALAEDPRWERSMLAPWRPVGAVHHLIIWIDLPHEGLETAIAAAVSGIVNDFLPGSTLTEMVPNPY
jgi:hypothetical protein